MNNQNDDFFAVLPGGTHVDAGSGQDRVFYDARAFDVRHGTPFVDLDGGRGTDTLVLKLTSAQYEALKQELDEYAAALPKSLNLTDRNFVSSSNPYGLHKNLFDQLVNGTLTTGQNDQSQYFTFNSLGIRVKQFEALRFEISDVQRIDFEDLAVGAGNESPIVDGYAGFDWRQAGVFQPTAEQNYGYVPASGTKLGFIAEAGGGEIGGYEDATAGEAFAFWRADETRDFDLLGLTLVGSSGDFDVVIRAFDDGVQVGARTVAVLRGAPGFVSLQSGLDGAGDTFKSVDRVEINSVESDGSVRVPGYFGVDDILIA